MTNASRLDAVNAALAARTVTGSLYDTTRRPAKAPARRKPARPYFTLAVREDGIWAPQFGDYDRETVEFELEDYLDHDHKRRDLKIVKSSVRPADVAAAIARLNVAK
jgi:hypothetical protein